MAANDFDIGKFVRLKKSAEFQVMKHVPSPHAGDYGEIVDVEVFGEGQDYLVQVPGYPGEWIYKLDEMQAISIKQIMLENNERNKRP